MWNLLLLHGQYRKERQGFTMTAAETHFTFLSTGF